MIPNFWKTQPSNIKRIFSILAFFFLATLVTTVGVLTPLSPEDTNALNSELEKIQQETKNMDVWQSTAFIFTNNFRICLLLFVPIAGPAIGFYAFYNTGLVIGAQSSVMHMPALTVFVALFVFPHTWMEFIAYSMALAQSVWLIRRIIQRKAKNELVKTCIFIAVCAAILLAAALAEAYLIASIPKA